PQVLRASDIARQKRGRKIISSAKGKVYDLSELFERLNRRYFAGEIPTPVLTWSKRRARRILGHHDAVHKTITISKALDSRYVPELTSLLQRVERELLILSTLHSHGAFSDPDGWLSIKHAIEEALGPARRVRVSCVFGNAEQRRNLLNDQFKGDFTDWPSWS